MSIIATERLVLRSWLPDDAPALLALYSDPQVTQHIPHVALADLPAAQAKLREMAAMEEQNGCTLWAVTSGGELVGVCGFRARWELGFAFRRDLWGKGFAQEAARACLEWGRRHGMARVIAKTREANLGSRRVLEKLGFADTGERDGPWWTYAR